MRIKRAKPIYPHFDCSSNRTILQLYSSNQSGILKNESNFEVDSHYRQRMYSSTVERITK